MTICLSHRPSDPAYYIVNWRIYVQVFCWSRSPWNLLFLAKSLITSGLENHKFIIFCWGKGQVQSPRCMFANYYPVIISIHQFKFHLPCLAWSCVADSLVVNYQFARGQVVRRRVANNIRNFLTSMNILSPDEILLKCTSVQQCGEEVCVPGPQLAVNHR